MRCRPKVKAMAALLLWLVLLAGCQNALPGARSNQSDYIYHPARLTRVQDSAVAWCKVLQINQEADGDRHLFCDPNDRSLLNAGNAHEKDTLVVEFVCVSPPTSAAAQAACARDPDPFTEAELPAIGMCIEVIGPLVEDTVHYNWREIHAAQNWRALPITQCASTRVMELWEFEEPGD